MSFILTPGDAARSVTAAVGMPPTQKKASILRSLMALTDSATPRRSRFMSLSRSRPAASMTRNAMTSVAPPGEPVETRLPLRSPIFSMPVPSIGHHVHAVGVEHHQGLQRDLAALELVLALERVEGGVGHGEADLALAGADQLEVVDRAAGDLGGRLHAGQVLRQHVGDGAAERVIDAAGAAGADRDGLLLRLGRAARQNGRRRPGPRPLAMRVSAFVSLPIKSLPPALERPASGPAIPRRRRRSPDRASPYRRCHGR